MKLLVDTDIGDDIDDAFALALALSSPEIDLLAVTTVNADTRTRARIVLRMLALSGADGVRVGVGDTTPAKAVFSQKHFGEQGPELPDDVSDAASLILETAKAHPGEVTLLAIGQLTNVAAAIRQDVHGFRQLRRVVVMGGSVRRGYELPCLPARQPRIEDNFKADPVAAAALFASGVDIEMVPLDAALLPIDEFHRRTIYSHGGPLTDALALLHWQWQGTTPVLFDPVALVYALDPSVCATERLKIEIDAEGWSRAVEGEPNVTVCLDRDADACLRFIVPRLLAGPVSRQRLVVGAGAG